MRKIIDWAAEHLLFYLTLFLLAFIPLYPKLPLLDIRNTWVYVRLEDFAVLGVLLVWLILFFAKKVNLKTPLTIPILAFWALGAIATLHGVVIIFPNIANVFPNVALLAYIRHIEYMSLFFVAYSSVRSKKQAAAIIWVSVITLFLIVIYGFGQRYLGFPAYLTMNEQYAKGLAIRLSDISRIPSTFAGQYDLGAYLVLVVPIFASLFFGIKNIFGKLVMLLAVASGFLLLLFTVSRISFFAVIVGLFAVLLFQKRKLILFAIPLLLILGVGLIAAKPTILNRFASSVAEVDVLVDGQTGNAVGEVATVPSSYFANKVIKQQFVKDKDELNLIMRGEPDSRQQATPGAIFRQELLPPQVPLVKAANVSNGDNLPQGTGYVNLTLSPVVKRVGFFMYELPPNLSATSAAQVLIFHGDFLVKKASAYDLSFTTRFQGEWPNAIVAFERNVLLGSGYGSASLAVDNNYLRMLAETGVLGTAAFFIIFLGFGLYIAKVLPEVDSPQDRALILGVAAGVIGLFINASLIDVFEASKVAYTLWILVGLTCGLLSLYATRSTNIIHELKKALGSTYAIVAYLLILCAVIYSPMLPNYFAGDDFTWLRWAADCGNSVCHPASQILNYITNSGGFFYRPGTKSYFYLMYSLFWLNQTVYHAVSLFAEFLVSVLFFFLAQKIFKDKLLAASTAFLFVIMSGYAEIVFWIAATGHIFNAIFMLLAILLFDLWDSRKKFYFLVGAFFSILASTLFHELGVVTPLLIIAYEVIRNSEKLKKVIRRWDVLIMFIPDVIYLIARFAASSHWQGGDYSYNLLKLPFNLVGNLLGYLLITVFGPLVLPVVVVLRNVMRENIAFGAVGIILIVAILYFVYTKIIAKLEPYDKRIIYFGLTFFVISLLPFVGLGGITSRYSYLASFGIIIILVWIFKKIYEYLLLSGREIAILALATIISIFALLHIVEVQSVNGDWHTAGGEVQNFLTSIDDLYNNEWSGKNVELHFVNTPIMTGNAWIFPVGLSDALWFSFKNPDLKIFEDSTVQQAKDEIGTDINKKAFEFQTDGSLKEIKRNVPIILTSPPK